MLELHCADRSRLLHVYLIRVGFHRHFGWPLPSEEAGNLLVSFCNGNNSGSCGPDFHDRDVAFSSQSSRAAALRFALQRMGFGNDVSVCCKH